MTCKELLIEFCKKKHEAIGTQYKYFLKEDEEEILSWTETECFSVIKKIFTTLNNTFGDTYISDGDICPWCIITDDRCEICGYRKRHGECDSPGATWLNIYELIGEISQLKKVKFEVLPWLLKEGKKLVIKALI